MTKDYQEACQKADEMSKIKLLKNIATNVEDEIEET